MKKIQIYFGNKLKKFKDFDELYEYVETKFNLYNFGHLNYESYIEEINKKLYESQLFSTDIDKVIRLTNNKFNIKLDKNSNNTIKYNLVKNGQKTFNNFHIVIDYLKNFGWNFSHIVYDDGVGLPKNSKEINFIENVSNLCRDVVIFISASNDIELLNYTGKTYHVTLDYLENKISKKGLTPRTNNKINNHKERVYMFLNYDKKIINKFAEDFLKYVNDDILYNYENYVVFNVYEIDMNKNINCRLFYDPFYKNNVAVYTLNSIRPDSINIIDKIDIRI